MLLCRKLTVESTGGHWLAGLVYKQLPACKSCSTAEFDSLLCCWPIMAACWCSGCCLPLMTLASEILARPQEMYCTLQCKLSQTVSNCIPAGNNLLNCAHSPPCMVDVQWAGLFHGSAAASSRHLGIWISVDATAAQCPTLRLNMAKNFMQTGGTSQM